MCAAVIGRAASAASSGASVVIMRVLSRMATVLVGRRMLLGPLPAPFNTEFEIKRCLSLLLFVILTATCSLDDGICVPRWQRDDACARSSRQPSLVERLAAKEWQR